MGPLRKASAVIALASIAREGSIPCFMAVPLLRSTIAQKCLILVFSSLIGIPCGADKTRICNSEVLVFHGNSQALHHWQWI
jgi:hypothetical protein